MVLLFSNYFFNVSKCTQTHLLLESTDSIVQKLLCISFLLGWWVGSALLWAGYWGPATPHDVLQSWWETRYDVVSWKHKNILRWNSFSILRRSCLRKWLWGLRVQRGDDRAWGCSFGGVPWARARVHRRQPAPRHCVSFPGQGSEWRRGEYTPVRHNPDTRF